MMLFAMVLATQLSRLSPLAFSKLKISSDFEEWLGHVPIAILTALVIPEIFHVGSAGLEVNRIYLAGAIVCLGVGYKTKNLLLTTFVGIVLVAVLRFFAL